MTLDDGFLFDFHYFVDSSEQSLTKLRTKLEPLSNSKRTSLNFKPGDCNKWLAELATALKKKKYAALVLLDPFGMQINWGSIAALKGTRSDIWILVPTGVIINRLLNRNGQLEHLEKLQSDANSWMGPKPMIWAAEIHPYKGKYYYFATFTNQSLKIDTVAENVIERRACHVLVSDKPHGPYVLMKDLHIYQRINQRWMELFGLKMEDLI